MAYDQNELATALVDVRRAYRLLWAYQRRIDQIARTFSQHLGFRHYVFVPEKQGTWSKLPMISCAHLDLRATFPDGDYNNYPKAGDMMLDMWFESDSEYGRINKFNGYRGEPAANEFGDAAQASSSLHVTFNKNLVDRDSNLNWFYKIWQPLGSEHLTPGILSESTRVAGIQRYRSSSFDLDDLGDEDSVLAAADSAKREFENAGGVWPSIPEEVAGSLERSV